MSRDRDAQRWGHSAAEYLTLRNFVIGQGLKEINHLPLTSECLHDRGYLIHVFPPPLRLPGPAKTFDRYMWKEGRKKGYTLSSHASKVAVQRDAILPLPCQAHLSGDSSQNAP